MDKTFAVCDSMYEVHEMKRGAYNIYRGWTLPEDENGDEEGYLLIDPKGDHNTKFYIGYVTWVSKDQYDKFYVEYGDKGFSLALIYLERGFMVCREGWNGKGMFVVMVKDHEVSMDESSNMKINPHFVIKGVDGMYNTWVPSVSDLLAKDWRLINN